MRNTPAETSVVPMVTITMTQDQYETLIEALRFAGAEMYNRNRFYDRELAKQVRSVERCVMAPHQFDDDLS